MRFHEVPKRALFSIPFQLADGFTIGIKGYGLVTEQRKGAYRYFADLGDRMEVVEPKTLYVDNVSLFLLSYPSSHGLRDADFDVIMVEGEPTSD